MRRKAWYPLGTRSLHSNPEVGTILAYDHAVWRVVAVNPVPDDLWTDEDRQQVKTWNKFTPKAIILRPIDVTGDDPRARDRDIHLRTRSPHHSWDSFPDEHYPVCSKCREPLPCREQESAKEAALAAKVMGRYDLPGICPACEEPITPRQRVHTFEENLVVPVGPPVTFHLRNGCIGTAADYDRRWCAVDPSRVPTLFCDGTITQHGTGARECSEVSCPGLKAAHRSYTICGCPRSFVGKTLSWGCAPINEVTL